MSATMAEQIEASVKFEAENKRQRVAMHYRLAVRMRAFLRPVPDLMHILIAAQKTEAELEADALAEYRRQRQEWAEKMATRDGSVEAAMAENNLLSNCQRSEKLLADEWAVEQRKSAAVHQLADLKDAARKVAGAEADLAHAKRFTIPRKRETAVAEATALIDAGKRAEKDIPGVEKLIREADALLAKFRDEKLKV